MIGTPALSCQLNAGVRSEEHTSELQSHDNLVCRLLLETKNYRRDPPRPPAPPPGAPARPPPPSPPHANPSRFGPPGRYGSTAGLSASGFFLRVRGPRSSPPFPPTTAFG